MANQFQEFPKWMHHPDHADAVFKPLTEAEQKIKGFMAPVPKLLSPERYPKIMVHTLEQEKQYAAKGYRPNNIPDQKAYDAAILESTHPDGFVFQAYPKWKYHWKEFPVVVNNKQEEDALGEDWVDSQVMATEEDVEKIPKAPKPAATPKPKKPKAKKKAAKSKAAPKTGAVQQPA